MKTDFSSSNNSWSNVATVAITALAIVTLSVLLIKFAQEAANHLNENDNTRVRCKTAGGEMGYSKCYKNGKEI
jgi:hypothetical protein